jgi:DNA-binding IclR family transcriptional regulator
MSSPANYPIESVENAARVLLMLRERSVLRVAEIAAELNIARSSAHRLLTTLQAHGLLRQDPTSRGYLAGPRLVELGVAVIGATDLRTLARPVLADLAKATGETAHLIVLEGAEIIFLDGVEGSGVIRAAARTGDRAPAHAAAAGKVLLAALSQEEFRARYSAARLRGGTENAIGARRDLETELARVREAGFATNQEESEEGLCAVAAPVCDATGAVRAALSLSGPSPRIRAAGLERLGLEVRDMAAQLGKQIG